MKTDRIRRNRSLLLILFGFLMIANLTVGYKLYSDANSTVPKDNGYQSISMLMNVIELLRKNYVDPQKVSYKKLVEGALKGMLSELDDFSVYEDSKGFKRTRENSEGKYKGIGVVVTIKNKVLEVVAPLEDSPGFKAGIKPGDVITKIEGHSTRSMPLEECVKLLKGPAGTEVAITIYRKSDDSTKDLSIERAEILNPGVKGAKIISDGIGYVRITQFSSTTVDALDKALNKLKKEKLKALIMDLRGNPGGLLASAIDICSRFIKEGELIVFTEGRDKSKKAEFFSTDCEKLSPEIPIVILVDGYSASASEIVAGCLKDHKRAFLLGERTFGKGSVQTLLQLPDASAVRFTTAKYYTPSEQVIHEVGIEPDIPVKTTRSEGYKLATQRSKFPGVIKPKVDDAITDRQLRRAVELLRGICLFSEAREKD